VRADAIGSNSCMKNSGLLDFVFPSRCAVCEALGPNLCEDCHQVLRPSPHDFQRGPIVGWAATYLSPEVSKLLVSFKDRGQSALVSDLNELIAPLVAELAAFTEVIYLVPAPSRLENFARRGFTPSVVLARALSNLVSNAHVLNCLVLAKDVKDQVGLSSAQRHENLARPLEDAAWPVACGRGHVVDSRALSPAQCRAARDACAGLVAAVLGLVGHSPEGAGATGVERPGLDGVESHFLVGHLGDSRGKALPVCGQVGHPPMALDRYLGHGLWQSVHRAH